MKIILSENDRLLKKEIKKTNGINYIYLNERAEDINRILNECSAKEIKIDNYKNDSFKNDFIELYVDFIGKLGIKYNSSYWWVTGTSAKNRFTSNFFDNLYIFYKIITILKDSKETLLIINPSKEIFRSISKYCIANSIDFKVLSQPMHVAIFDKIKNTRSLFYMIYFICGTWRRIYISNKYLKKKFISQIQPEKEYYTLRSWFYDKSINENSEYHDSFFGVLPSYLMRKGRRVLIVAGTIGNFKSIVGKITDVGGYFIITEELLLGYADPIRVVFDIYFNRIQIKDKIDLDGLDVSDILKVEIDKEFKGQQILRDYLHYYYAKRLSNIIKIDTFTTIYENNAWEKMWFLALKKYSPQTKTIGYQHTILCEASINMILSKYEKNIVPIPDKINTLGNVTKNYLETYGNYNENRVKASCALRFETLNVSDAVSRKRSNNILLVLGGILPRAIDMINFVFRALNNNGKYKIIIRPHPALPLHIFKQKLDFKLEKHDQFSVSANMSIEEDMQEVDIVIYDASTISLESLMMGIPVIHIALQDMLSYDNLFQCNHFKWTVSNEEELAGIIDAIYELNDKKYYYEQSQARKYVEDYLFKVTDKNLSEFII